MYGLKQAPIIFFENIMDRLTERGFEPSTHDIYLFMKNNITCVVYVDIIIIYGPGEDAIE